MRPRICLITAPIVLGGDAEDALVARVAAAGRAGVDLIQVRQPGADGGPLLRLVRRCAEAAGAARVLVNDRLDVALAGGAHGVHLRSDSMPAARVRELAPAGFLVGRSVHGVAEAREAEAGGGLDYLVLGTIFPSASKPGRSALGVGELSIASAAVTLPVLAIGGVTVARLPELRRAGAAGIAAIGLFADVPLDRLPAVADAIRRGWATEEAP